MHNFTHITQFINRNSSRMKKLIPLFVFCLLSAKVFGQIFVENFSYQEGIYLFQTGNWTNIGPPQTPITVLSPGLSFPAYAGSGIGNMVAITADGNGVHSSFSEVQSDGSIFASFMLRVIYPFTQGSDFFALRSSEGDNYAVVKIKEYDSPQFQLAITKSGQQVIHYTSPLFDAGAMYLVVVKYKFIDGGNNDEVSLFVFDSSNPPPLSEPAPTVLPETNNVPDAPNLSGVALMQGGSISDQLYLSFDGIYVYKGWFPEGALPVELSGFSSEVSGNDVILNWRTSSEINNSHFDIERSENETWTKIGSVRGNGSTPHASVYSFRDKNLSPGKYSYRLRQSDYNGNFRYYDLENEVEIMIPVKYSLYQNYPNPFNPVTTIGYEIPSDGNVRMVILDISGKEVAVLMNEFRSAGYHELVFNSMQLPSGVYFYRMDINSFKDVKKMLILK